MHSKTEWSEKIIDGLKARPFPSEQDVKDFIEDYVDRIQKDALNGDHFFPSAA